MSVSFGNENSKNCSCAPSIITVNLISLDCADMVVGDFSCCLEANKVKEWAFHAQVKLYGKH